MSHTKYHTEALILGGADTGEADRYIWALTREFGMIGFHARSARKIASRQRPFLQPLLFSKLSLIRGKNMWRLTNVENSRHFEITNSFLSRARVANFLKRLLKGEEESAILYDTVLEGFKALESKMVSSVLENYIEKLLVFRILFLLGYIKKDKELSSLLDSPLSYDEEILALALKRANLLKTRIDHALEISGL